MLDTNLCMVLGCFISFAGGAWGIILCLFFAGLRALGYLQHLAPCTSS